jgi:probable selenate reductase FAD-binding subunit
MILEYHRPDKVEEALELLKRAEPTTLPLGGGSVLSAPSDDPIAVVDLQGLGLDKINRKGSTLELGATVTLQGLLDEAELSPALYKAMRHEAAYNLRQVATVAGALVSADGRSPFATAMLALDAQLTLLPGEEQVGLGDLLPLRAERLKGRLITQISVPTQVKLAYEYVARSPADLPVVCAAVAQWKSGRTRVALGGYGGAPVVAMDGKGDDGAAMAAKDAYQQAGDEWASAEYRMGAAETLTKRCLEALKGN